MFHLIQYKYNLNHGLKSQKLSTNQIYILEIKRKTQQNKMYGLGLGYGCGLGLNYGYGLNTAYGLGLGCGSRYLW